MISFDNENKTLRYRSKNHETQKNPFKMKGFCFLGRRWDSNPRPSVPQTDALTN